jgi:hypothetical protein
MSIILSILDEVFSRSARRGLRKSRQSSGGKYVHILKQGEAAYRAGKPPSANPHTGEDAEIWLDGYNDAKHHY